MGEEKKQGELKKVLGLGDLMGIGIGQIIGSGIMSLTGICIALTGAGTPFAFLTAALLVLCPNMVLAVLGAAVPATGGMYTYVRDYIGRKTGFFYLALLVAGQLVLAMFAITFAVYMHDLLPGTNQTVVAFVLLTVCFIMNILAVRWLQTSEHPRYCSGSCNGIIHYLWAAKIDWSAFDSIDKIMPKRIY